MEISRSEEKSLLKAGIEIVGEFLRIEDVKNKVIHEIHLAEIGQMRLKRSIMSFLKSHHIYSLSIHKWDLSVVKIQVENVKVEDIRCAIKSINIFFYSES
jgi:hypothetical protein